MRDDPRQANAVSRRDDYKRDFDFFRVADKLGWRSGDARADIGLGWTHKHLDHPIFQVIDQINDDLVLNGAYTSEAPWLGRKNLFTIGGLVARGETEEDRYTNLGGNTGVKTADQDLKVVTLELFAENQHYLASQLALSVGVQAVLVAVELHDEFLSNGDNSDSENFDALNPKVGLRYEADPDTQVFVNVSRSFENPTFGEITNNAAGGLNIPDAQSAWTLEVGSRGRAGAIAWDLALYHSWIDGELLSLIDPVTSAPLGTINADRTIHRGVEAGVDLDLYDGGKDGKVVVRTAYLFNDFRFKDDDAFDTNEIAGLPRHVLNAELAFETGFGLVIAPNVHYVPVRTYIDHANTYDNPKHAAWGLRTTYVFKSFSFFVDARNLTNRVYAGTTGVIANAGGTDQAQFLPSDGRSVYGGVEFKW
jgi:iron complex outermembrane receptor protein